jgi:hypothetical protein
MKYTLLDLILNKQTMLYGIRKPYKKFRPFKLTAPRKGIEKKRHPYYKGGAWGNREEQINQLATKML